MDEGPQFSGLVKYMNDQNGNGRGKVHWHRAAQDGAPFRGQIDPMMREEEFEDRLVEVRDAKNGIFDVNDPDQNAIYLAVMDRIANGHYQAIFIDRRFDEEKKTWLVYIEWAEKFMEDGHPVAARDQNAHPRMLTHGTPT